jgi:hypothetical protein
MCHNRLLVFKDFKPLLHPAIQSMQKMLVEEKQTDALDKHYCQKDDCSKFVNKNSLADGVTISACKRCGKKTCIVCRNLVRLPNHQKNYIGCVWNQEIEALVDGIRIQQCHSCSTYVKKVGRCHDMPCQCSVLFCFRCGLRLRSDEDVRHEEMEEPDKDESDDDASILDEDDHGGYGRSTIPFEIQEETGEGLLCL